MKEEIPTNKIDEEVNMSYAEMAMGTVHSSTVEKSELEQAHESAALEAQSAADRDMGTAASTRIEADRVSAVKIAESLKTETAPVTQTVESAVLAQKETYRPQEVERVLAPNAFIQKELRMETLGYQGGDDVVNIASHISSLNNHNGASMSLGLGTLGTAIFLGGVLPAVGGTAGLVSGIAAGVGAATLAPAFIAGLGVITMGMAAYGGYKVFKKWNLGRKFKNNFGKSTADVLGY